MVILKRLLSLIPPSLSPLIRTMGSVVAETPCPLPSVESSKSFWLSEPDLLGYRTTEDLPSSADIVVVGTGITGASALRYLAASGQKLNIVALDAREICWGASGRNGGHLQAVPYARTPSIGAFEIAGCNEVHSYIVDNNVSCEYRALSAVRSFWTREGLDEILPKVERLKKENPTVGATINVVTEPDELEALGIKKGALGALVNNAAATVWPYKVVMHMIKSLVEEKAVNIQTNTPVEQISNEDGIWVLHTPRGAIRAPKVILATNAYISHLLHDFSPLIVPARGYVTAQVPPTQNKTPPDIISNSHALIGHSANAGGDLDEDDYLVQRPYLPGPNNKTHLIFGGGHYDGKLPSIGAASADDSVVDEAAIAYLRRTVPRAFKVPGETESQEELEAEYSWSGIMGYSRDNRPWVGEMPGMSGLFMSAGYTGHGLPNGPMCAKAIVDMVLNGTSGTDVVKKGMLPEDYLLTKERIREAMKMPSLIEDEAQPGEL